MVAMTDAVAVVQPGCEESMDEGLCSREGEWGWRRAVFLRGRKEGGPGDVVDVMAEPQGCEGGDRKQDVVVMVMMMMSDFSLLTLR